MIKTNWINIKHHKKWREKIIKTNKTLWKILRIKNGGKIPKNANIAKGGCKKMTEKISQDKKLIENCWKKIWNQRNWREKKREEWKILKENSTPEKF